MSLRDIERSIWREAMEVTRNPKLRLKDILEWSTGNVDARKGEVVIDCPIAGVRVAIPEAADRSEGREQGETE